MLSTPKTKKNRTLWSRDTGASWQKEAQISKENITIPFAYSYRHTQQRTPNLLTFAKEK